MKHFADLGAFVRYLESRGELKRVTASVDPALEITEIAIRSVKSGGPALLFENVKGASYPLLINAFASERRIAAALGRPPQEVGEQIQNFALDMMPPKPSKLWKHRGLFGRALAMRPKKAKRGPAHSAAPNLDALPVLTCWPEDGGRFITLPSVITINPAGKRNLGMYRLQVFDKSTTGMHIQIQRGGGAHYAEWEEIKKPMPVAVALGGDPVSMMAPIFPLPENIDELAFAGFLRGKPVPTVRLVNGVDAPADAEFILEGYVAPDERRQEGPFGDHFGHYSHAAPFPVFHVERVHAKPKPIYPATVVGKPPQEDKFLGNAIQEMFLPLLKVMKPELVDLWTYFEAGFHNLAVAAVKQRYKKEALKLAFGLLGEGQMSLTKCIVLVDPGVNVRSFTAVLEALHRNFDPAEDLLLLPGTAQDTLDFTSFKMNLGSKMVLDATSYQKKPRLRGRGILPDNDADIIASRNWNDSLLALQVRGQARAAVERLVKNPAFAGYKIIAAVSEDIPLNDDELLIWGLFTRFDCARDLIPAGVEMRGGCPVYKGPLGIDATWKNGYPKPLVMDQNIVERVNKRWGEYGL